MIAFNKLSMHVDRVGATGMCRYDAPFCAYLFESCYERAGLASWRRLNTNTVKTAAEQRL